MQIILLVFVTVIPSLMVLSLSCVSPSVWSRAPSRENTLMFPALKSEMGYSVSRRERMRSILSLEHSPKVKCNERVYFWNLTSQRVHMKTTDIFNTQDIELVVVDFNDKARGHGLVFDVVFMF